MFNKNSISAGLILGIVIPLLAFPLFYGLFTGMESMSWMSDEGFRPQFKLRTTAILAIAMNAIALNKFQKKRFDESMRGVVFPTFIYVVIWVLVFGKTIF